MFSSVCKTTPIFALVVLIGCAIGTPKWTQFQGGLSNQGYQPIDSGFALSSEWASAPYKITSSSPVIGKDIEGQEVIYIGTVDAQLVAINSEDGSERWTHSFASGDKITRIFSTPAVSSGGDIYVISNRRISAGRARSTLHKVDQFNNLNWSYPIPDNGFTFGSPKILEWGEDTLIFVYVTVGTIRDVQGELLVLRDDRNKAGLLDRKSFDGCKYGGADSDHSIGEVFEPLAALWEFISVFPIASDKRDIALPDMFVDPTVAVTTGKEHALIAIADNLCNIGVFKWEDEKLAVIWREAHNFEKHSSIALLPNGLMVFGSQFGMVMAYDVETGVKVWEYDAGQPVFATPAAPLGQFIFVVSKNHLQVLQQADGSLIYDGALPRKLKLAVSTHTSPAVTANRVYLSAWEMLTLSHDLKTRGHDTNFRGNGLSSIAIGNDGAVYVVAIDGTIRKYKGTE